MSALISETWRDRRLFFLIRGNTLLPKREAMSVGGREAKRDVVACHQLQYYQVRARAKERERAQTIKKNETTTETTQYQKREPAPKKKKL